MASVNLNVCGKVLRFIFIIVQLVFFVIGLALVAGGIYLLVVHHDYQTLTGNSNISGAAILLTAGGVTVIVSGLGMFGAFFLSQILLGLYAFAVVVIICLEIVAGIIGFVFREDLRSRVSDNALDSIRDYNVNDTSSDENDAVDFFQNEFDCCGWDSLSNWNGGNNTYFETTKQFPDSCTCNSSSPCIHFPSTDQNIWNRTCENRVLDVLKEYQAAVGGVGIAIGIFEVLVLLVAIGLCCTIKSAKGEYTTV